MHVQEEEEELAKSLKRGTKVSPLKAAEIYRRHRGRGKGLYGERSPVDVKKGLQGGHQTVAGMVGMDMVPITLCQEQG